VRAIPLTCEHVADLPSCSGCDNHAAVLLDSQPFCLHCAGGLAVNFLIQKTAATNKPPASFVSSYNDRPRSFLEPAKAAR